MLENKTYKWFNDDIYSLAKVTLSKELKYNCESIYILR